MIEIKDLSKNFAVKDGNFTAIHNINLTIQDGDVFGIIGMSGAGKSTLIRCLNLLERPASYFQADFRLITIQITEKGAIKMKKLLALTLSLVLALSLTACSGSSTSARETTDVSTVATTEEDASGIDEEASAKTVVLKVAASPTPHAEILTSDLVTELLQNRGPFWKSSSILIMLFPTPLWTKGRMAAKIVIKM